MSTKRIKLPSANDVLVGGARPSGTRSKSTKALKKHGAKEPRRDAESVPREHISTYLRPDVIIQLERVRVKLLENKKKLTKSELIERALRIGLRYPDELAK